MLIIRYGAIKELLLTSIHMSSWDDDHLTHLGFHVFEREYVFYTCFIDRFSVYIDSAYLLAITGPCICMHMDSVWSILILNQVLKGIWPEDEAEIFVGKLLLRDQIHSGLWEFYLQFI